MPRQRPRRGSWRRIAPALIGTAVLGACQDPPRGPSCPEGTVRDAGRLERLHQRLFTDPDARALVVATHGRYVVCFGDGIEPGVDARHRVRLDRGQDDRSSAAKLGHLLVHVRRGLPFVDGDTRPCAERLARARTLEEAAHDQESRLRRRFGLPALDEGAVERVMAGYRLRCQH